MNNTAENLYVNRIGPIKFALVSGLAASLFLAIAIFIQPKLPYGNGFECDSWYWFGIYRQYFETLATSSVYQLSRYTALIPWIYVDPYLSGETSAIIRFAAYYVITVAAFAYTARTLLPPHISIITCILFAASKLVLGSFSHEYMTGAGLMWCSLLVAAIVRSGFSHRPLLAGVATGALAVCTISAHVTTAIFMLTTPFLFFCAKAQWSKAGLRRFAVFGLGNGLGVVAGAALIGLYAASIGRDFFYLTSAATASSQWIGRFQEIHLGFEWVKGDANVHLLNILSAAAIALLVRKAIKNVRREPVELAPLVPVLVFLGMRVFILGWHLAGLQALELNAYGPFMYPVAFVAMGSMLFEIIGSPRLGWLLSSTASVITLFVLSLALLLEFHPAALWPSVGIGIGLTGIFLFAPHGRAAWSVTAALLVIFLTITFPPHFGKEPWVSGVTWRDAYRSLDDIDDYIDELRLTETPKFWIQSDTTSLSPALAPRTMLQCATYPSNFPRLEKATTYPGVLFPAMEEIAPTYLAEGSILILVGEDRGLAARGSAALARLGFVLDAIGPPERVIGMEGLRVAATTVRRGVGPLVAGAPLATVVASGITAQYWPQATVELNGGAATIRTQPGGGSFSALVAVPTFTARKESGRARIHVTVLKGTLTVFPSKLGDASLRLHREIRIEEGAETVVDVEIPDLSQPTWLIFANGSAGEPSEARVSQIEIYPGP